MSKRRLTRRHLLTSAAFAFLGGLAGCSEIPVDNSVSAPPESTPTSAAESPSTPTETWTPPSTPHQPTEDKQEDRINDVDFINKKPATNENGYTDFDLQVGANTWMEDVDPPEDEAGEPYFVVEINGTLVARTDIVPFRKEGSFPIPIKRAALEHFDAGTLKVRVLLFEEDSHSEDLYDTWTGTIEYNP